jgi:putative copper resistance protein D
MTPPSLAVLTLGRGLSTWSFRLWPSIVLAVLLVAYLSGVRAARRRGVTWQRRRTASWVAGVAVITAATMGSPQVYGEELFWMHMVAHLMLIMVAPIFLVLGRPLDLAVAAVPPRGGRQQLRDDLHGPVVSALTHPGVGLVLYALAIVGTHLTGFMNAMVVHPWMLGFEEIAYVVAGTLFLLPLIGGAPIRWRLAPPLRMAVFVVAMPIDTFTGVILGQQPTYPWANMAAMQPSWGPGAISDLHIGGAVMWVGGDAIMAVLFGVAAVAWARAAAAGDGSELGSWLGAARLSHQMQLSGFAPDDVTVSASADSDEALAAYNRYLAGLHGGADASDSGRAVHREVGGEGSGRDR